MIMPNMCPFEKKEKGVFFRLPTFFFRNKKKFFQGTTFVQFSIYCKAKKHFGVIRKFLKIFFFLKLLSKFSKKFFWITPKIFFAL